MIRHRIEQAARPAERVPYGDQCECNPVGPIERLAQSEHAGERQHAEVEARARHEATEPGEVSDIERADAVLRAFGDEVEPGVEREKREHEPHEQVRSCERDVSEPVSFERLHLAAVLVVSRARSPPHRRL